MPFSNADVRIEWWGLPLVATLSIREGEPATRIAPAVPREPTIVELRLVSETDSYDLTELLVALHPRNLQALTTACFERIDS